MIQHDSNISSLDFIDADHFVSGSWDGNAIVWSISQRKKTAEFTQHKYAVSVFYNPITDTIISGSQDKALNMWSWKDSKLIKRHENAHNDIIREISLV
jgi:WD40 repeat protein